MFTKSTGPPNAVEICVIVRLMRRVHWKVKVHNYRNLFNIDSWTKKNKQNLQVGNQEQGKQIYLMSLKRPH